TIEVSTRTSDLTPPSFTGLSSATPAGAGAVRLTWAAASDNVDLAAAIKYRVYSATTAGGENFAAPTLTTASGITTATVTGLLDATTYYFVVRAAASAANKDKNPVERSPTTADTTPPDFGGATSAMPGPNSITLNWAAANDRVTPAAQIVYLIYQ